ncbi:MAG: DUF664 domain-containing protein [Luteitalea sp.]|nr:DUF664 domain-containing protein [Luteitalea sp.]
MNARALLIETHVHIPPGHALEQLGAADAERRLPGAGHSIADIVSHMSFWQEWFCRRCAGVADRLPAPAARGWPDVTPGSWPDLHARFAAGLERAAALADRVDQAITPAIEFAPLAGYTVGDALVHIAQHNSYHLGQVVLLRQMMSLWPPPSGSWTW